MRKHTLHDLALLFTTSVKANHYLEAAPHSMTESLAVPAQGRRLGVSCPNQSPNRLVRIKSCLGSFPFTEGKLLLLAAALA